MKYINVPDAEDRKRIVVIGAGFGGLKFVKQLAKSKAYQIILLDRNNFHQFQPLYYQVGMSGLEPSSICFPIRKIFRNNDHVFFRVAEVLSIDSNAKQVSTDMGYLDYDFLVLAVGAKTNYFGNEKLKESTLALKTVSDAIYLRNELLQDFEHALETADYERRQGLIDIVIVGGGPTGVELAGALAEMKKYILPKDYKELDHHEVDIYLIQGASVLLKGMSAKASAKAEQFLKDLGVIVKLNTRVTDFDGEYVSTKSGEKIKARKVIWAAGIKGQEVKGVPKECIVWGNRLCTNGLHQVENTEDIFAIGDIAYTESDLKYPEGHPQVAQVAIQMGDHLADYFKNLEKEKNTPDFRYKDKGSMATIGRNKAVVDLPSFSFSGFFAWIVWLVVHLFALIGIKNKLFVMLNWIWNYLTYDQSLRLIIKPKKK